MHFLSKNSSYFWTISSNFTLTKNHLQMLNKIKNQYDITNFVFLHALSQCFFNHFWLTATFGAKKNLAAPLPGKK